MREVCVMGERRESRHTSRVTVGAMAYHHGMQRMSRCAGCGGFVPGAERCPNCGAPLGTTAKALGLVKGVVAVGLSVATSITLMACYGPPVVRTDSGPPPTPAAAPARPAAADGAGAAPTTTATGSAKP